MSYRVLKTNIVGVYHYAGAQTRLNRLRPGHTLTLRREPRNPHDRNAVAVYDDELKLGHLPREVAASLAFTLDIELPVSCVLGDYEPAVVLRWLFARGSRAIDVTSREPPPSMECYPDPTRDGD